MSTCLLVLLTCTPSSNPVPLVFHVDGSSSHRFISVSISVPLLLGSCRCEVLVGEEGAGMHATFATPSSFPLSTTHLPVNKTIVDKEDWCLDPSGKLWAFSDASSAQKLQLEIKTMVSVAKAR